MLKVILLSACLIFVAGTSFAAEKNEKSRKPASGDCNDMIDKADRSLMGPIDPQIKAINDAVIACSNTKNKETFKLLSRSCGDIESTKFGVEGRGSVRACWLRAMEFVHSVEDVQEMETAQ